MGMAEGFKPFVVCGFMAPPIWFQIVRLMLQTDQTLQGRRELSMGRIISYHGKLVRACPVERRESCFFAIGKADRSEVFCVSNKKVNC